MDWLSITNSLKPRRGLLVLFSLLALCSLAVSAIMPGAAAENTEQTSPTPAADVQSVQAATVRRVNVTYDMEFSQTAIFWFGVDSGPQQMPGRNYADVRVRYTATGLQIKVIGIDYYLWYDDRDQTGDLTQYDSVAIYLDTGHDRASAPKTDDYYFLLGARNWEDPARYRRQAQGNGSAWNTAWAANWTNNFYGAWENGGGYNLNNSHVDYGWDGTFIIPWSVFGLTNPPADGSLWGLGVQVYDRDSGASNGMAAPQFWPETFNANNPATWGELHFGAPSYTPPPGSPAGTIAIQAQNDDGNDNVEDAWVGGGPHGLSGHMGNGSDLNHGTDRDLFVGNEQMPVHFPYFDKSFFRFSLASVPAGKTIQSAKLYLYHWGNANPVEAVDSWVHLFTIRDAWAENTITWNNAPLAFENVAMSWMDPIRGGGFADPPKEYFWDASQAVAEAYAAGQPVSIAIYSSDVDQHSNRYLYGSEADQGLKAYRPKLVITYGAGAATLTKRVDVPRANSGDAVNYTLTWSGTGQAQSLTDTLPVGLNAPTNLTVNVGTASYNAATRQITWSATPAAGQAVQLTYRCTVQTTSRQLLTNTAVLQNAGASSTAGVGVCANCPAVYLPVVIR
jgi:hypothetical protein